MPPIHFPSKKVMPRFFCVVVVLIFAAVAILVKAGYIMSVERKEWMEEKELERANNHIIEPKRGSILACDGRVLATSMPEYLVTIDFCTYEKDSLQRVKDQYRRDTVYQNHADEICEGMHRLFPDINKKKYRAYLDSCQKEHRRACPLYPPHVTSLTLPRGQKANKQLTYLELCEVRKLPLFNLRSSLCAAEVKLRSTPYGALAYRTVGSFKDSARFGLERAYDSVLAGTPGRYHNEKVRNTRIKRIDQPVEDGLDVMTTLDIDLQDLCKQALTDELLRLDADSGSLILMEVATGDVKAIVSLQDKNNDGNFIEHTPYAVSSMMMPGSVFKTCSFMVAMDDGRVKYTDQVDIHGGAVSFGPNNIISDDHYRAGISGYRDVKTIIEESLNTGTALMIWNNYRNDPQTFINGVHRVGMTADLEVPIEGYHKPYVASPADKHRYWSNALDLPRLAIGYSSLFSPINIVTFYAGIANNGRMMYPRFVKGFMKNGQMVEEKQPRVLREQMAKPEVIANLQEALVAAANKGTAHRAASALVPFAGKTGTAQIFRNGHRIPGYYSIMFVGYFPAKNPKYAMVVNMQKKSPAYGNMCAFTFRNVAELVMAKEIGKTTQPEAEAGAQFAPTVQAGNLNTTERTLRALRISHRSAQPGNGNTPVWGYNQAQGATPIMQRSGTATGMPDVIGYGLRDAVFRLESLGLRVRVKGQGTVVLQSIPAGKTIRPGESVVLTLENRRERKKAKPKAPTPTKKDSTAATTPRQ